MSACYEEWALGVAGDESVIALIDRLPAAKRQPNLVFSAARYLGAGVTDYAGFAGWLTARWQQVAAVCLSHATQTNEPGRCATLVPALASLGGPLSLIEVGASAGLCLYPDLYAYRYRLGDGSQHLVHPGSEADTSGTRPPSFDCDVSGTVALPESLPEVVWRAGIDLHPLHVSSAEDVAWLEALIWPEHDDRRTHLREAVAIARAHPVELIAGDLLAEIEGLVARAPLGSTVVVFHTAVLAYLDEADRRTFSSTMAALDVAWLANEGQGVVPGVMERLRARAISAPSTSDFVLAVDGEPIAFTQPHGRAMHGLP